MIKFIKKFFAAYRAKKEMKKRIEYLRKQDPFIYD
jgi:hypothetical protein